MSCVFCYRIDREDFEGSSATSVWFEPLNPVTPGHMLFVPNEHATRVRPILTALAVADAMYYAGDHQIEDFNIIINMGEKATQTIEHAHVHLVPRQEEDGLKLPWTGQIKE